MGREACVAGDGRTQHALRVTLEGVRTVTELGNDGSHL